MSSDLQALPPSPLPTPSPALAVAALLSAIGLHAFNWPTYPPDFIEYLVPWYEHILRHGPVGAFAQPFSNYTPTYLYLLALTSLLHPAVEPHDAIKLLSLAGTAFLGLGLAALLRASGVTARWLWLIAFLVPSATINSSKLGQCDAMWAGACLFAVACALRGRLRAMLLFAGLAVAFKAQAAFLAPFLFAVLITRRAPLHWWLIPPAVYAALMAPAWLMGWPATDLLLVYLRQSADLPDFISSSPQPWILLRWLAPDAAAPLFPLGFLAALAATMWIAFGFRRQLGTAKGMLLVALLSSSLIPFLLPKMHERYLLLADMLALALALIARDRTSITIAVLTQSSSLLALASYTHSLYEPVLVAFLLTVVALGLTLRMLLAEGARPALREPALLPA